MPTHRTVRPRRSSQTLVGRRARDLRIRIGADIRQMREDSGASQREISDAAGIDHGYLSLIERGLRDPSITALTAIATALGADASIRLFPGAGPRLRDPIQARIGEALLRILHPRWDRMLEVPVLRPARGFIDLVLIDRPPTLAICTEIQSEMRGLEQLIRWANQKALALPSAPFWDRMEETPRIDRLLVVRSTRTNREIAARFADTLVVAYPGNSIDTYRALTTSDAAWRAPTLLWADLRGDVATILDRSPRGVLLGR
jgi:transcriptional regulator with XRE-family HTH domain